MAIRPSMQPLVDKLRQHGAVGTTEVFNTVTYWTDEQLEAILDGVATPMNPLILKVNVAHDLWQVDVKPYLWVDPDTIDIQEADGSTLYSAYVSGTDTITGFGVYTHENSKVDATGLTPNTNSYAMFGYWISMYDALAMLWDEKANQRYDYMYMKAGQNTLRMQQEYDHCIGRAKYYRSKIARAYQRTTKNNGKWVV